MVCYDNSHKVDSVMLCSTALKDILKVAGIDPNATWSNVEAARIFRHYITKECVVVDGVVKYRVDVICWN